MKTRWEYLEFADCIDKIVYTNKIKRKDFLAKGEYRIISQEENYINGYWNAETDLFKIIKPVVIFGDHTKNLKYIDFDFVLGADGVKIFQPIDCINTKYFYYFLKSVKLKDLGYARHYRLLKEIKVPLPPIPEQKRIVKILDEAFAAIDKAKANAEKNLQNSRELFDSYLNKVFAPSAGVRLSSAEGSGQRNPGEDWEEKKLGECFKLKSGDGLTSKNMSREGNIPVYGGNGIAGSHNEYNLSGSNVIVGRVGALCGNARHINENIWLTDNAFKIINFKYEFDNSFLTYLLNYTNLKSYARQAAQPVISNSSLQDVKLHFPHFINEQKQIVKKLDGISSELNKLETIYQQKLTDLEELKKSILQKAFEGQLSIDNG